MDIDEEEYNMSAIVRWVLLLSRTCTTILQTNRCDLIVVMSFECSMILYTDSCSFHQYIAQAMRLIAGQMPFPAHTHLF